MLQEDLRERRFLFIFSGVVFRTSFRYERCSAVREVISDAIRPDATRCDAKQYRTGHQSAKRSDPIIFYLKFGVLKKKTGDFDPKNKESGYKK